VKELQPHPEVERSYAELREEFRATHLADLRSQFADHKYARRWNWIKELGERYPSPVDWALEMLKRLDAPVKLDFGLSETPESLGEKLNKQAIAALEHEQVTWDDSVEGVVDHDAAPMPDHRTLTDDEICDYVEREIERSREK
jgi:hypothetical protein